MHYSLKIMRSRRWWSLTCAVSHALRPYVMMMFFKWKNERNAYLIPGSHCKMKSTSCWLGHWLSLIMSALNLVARNNEDNASSQTDHTWLWCSWLVLPSPGQLCLTSAEWLGDRRWTSLFGTLQLFNHEIFSFLSVCLLLIPVFILSSFSFSFSSYFPLDLFLYTLYLLCSLSNPNRLVMGLTTLKSDIQRHLKKQCCITFGTIQKLNIQTGWEQSYAFSILLTHFYWILLVFNIKGKTLKVPYLNI